MEEEEERLRGLQEELSNLEMLVQTVGWKALMCVAEQQVENRLPTVLTKMENLLLAAGQEFEKGEIAGIQLFMQLPEIRIESLKDDINTLEEELGYDDGERTTSGGSDIDDGGTFEPAI